MSIIACDGTIDDPIPEYDVLATFVYSICLFIKTINVVVLYWCSEVNPNTCGLPTQNTKAIPPLIISIIKDDVIINVPVYILYCTIRYVLAAL